jgi:ATP-binding cassette subfamily C protein LapB
MDTVAERVFVEQLKSTVGPEQTLIITTHKTALLALTNRVVVIDHGRIVADGPTQEVLKRMAGRPVADS